MNAKTAQATLRLTQPMALAGGTLPNRIAKAAMSEKLSGPEGAPTEGHVELYRRWGRGGSGLLITGNVMVDARALEGPGNVVVEDERDVAMLTRWADAAQADGARLWMQISHPGRQTPKRVSRRPVAPSAVPMRGMFGLFSRPRALTEAEILDIVQRFATTAAVAKRAGFAGVQIHAAHGYLASQFLSPRTNRRSDRWGGTPEKRRRFLLEVVRAVRAAVGPDFGVGVKLNSADFQRGGFTEEESMEVVRALELEGVDLLEISGGSYESAVMFTGNKRTQEREAYFMAYAERVRRVTTLPLMLTGGFRTAAGMEAALASGAIDVAGMGRPLAVEPDLADRMLSGQAERAVSVRLRTTGYKKLDAMISGAWHEGQIKRMARGLAPDPGLGRIAALVASFRATYAPKVDTAACVDARARSVLSHAPYGLATAPREA